MLKCMKALLRSVPNCLNIFFNMLKKLSGILIQHIFVFLIGGMALLKNTVSLF